MDGQSWWQRWTDRVSEGKDLGLPPGPFLEQVNVLEIGTKGLGGSPRGVYLSSLRLASPGRIESSRRRIR
ncbi:hypothetical protein M514_23374 [Trichuris suis]|uniref:Uncharacterized protein n=1 Tax=Trichuris suis TaxID=68888 RepID=A0A085N4Y1_9BILA|nr:hypothetical protein M514_23374 [Trichuris suis]